MFTECFQPRTGASIHHSCTPAASKQNPAELVAKEEGREEIVVKVLKDIVEEGSSSVRLKQMKGETTSASRLPVDKTRMISYLKTPRARYFSDQKLCLNLNLNLNCEQG